MTWLSQNIIGMVGVVVGGFIAYHVYFLSKKLELKDRLTHKESIRKRVEPILEKIEKGGRRKIELINVKKYFSHYPNTNECDRNGYTYLGAELKALRYDGVEFFCGIREVYKDASGCFFLREKKNCVKQDFNIFEVGIVPYEWIDYIDPRGDEFSYRPQFFTQFKGKKKYPYRRLVYYIESGTYQEGNDPVDMKWTTIEVKK